MPCSERNSTSNADESLRSACISCTDLNNLVNVQSRMYHFRRKHVTNMTVLNPESQRRLLTPALHSWVHQSNATKKKEASRVPQFFVFGLKGWPAAQNNQPSTEHILPAERLHWQHRNPRLFARLLQLRKPLARNNCRDRVRKVKENSLKLNWKKHFKKLRSQRDPFSQRVAKTPLAIWLICPSAWSTIRNIHLCHISRLQRIPKFRVLRSHTRKEGQDTVARRFHVRKDILERSKVLDSHPPLRLQLSGLIRLILGVWLLFKPGAKARCGSLVRASSRLSCV